MKLNSKLTLSYAVLACIACTLSAADNTKINTLIISGDDVDAHPWIKTQAEYRQMLLDSGKFDVRISEDMNILESAKALAKYDLIFFIRANVSGEALSDQAKANLEYFLSNGKGLVINHMASGSFPEWLEFKKMCGVYWSPKDGSGHAPGTYVFDVTIQDKNHPITKDMDTFQADDELYSALVVAPDTQYNILATGVTTFKGHEGEIEPLAITLNYGKGRVFHQCFGHTEKSLQKEGVRELIVKGSEWAATGKVTQ